MPSLLPTSQARVASLLAVLAIGGGAGAIAGCGGDSEPASDAQTQSSSVTGETNPDVANPAITTGGESETIPSGTAPGSTAAPGSTTVPGGSPSSTTTTPSPTATSTTPQATGGHAAPQDDSTGGASSDASGPASTTPDGGGTSTSKSGAAQDPDCRPGTGPGQADPQCEPVSGPDAQDEDR